MQRMLYLTLAMGMALAYFATNAHAATTTGMVVSTDAMANVVTIETADGRNVSFTKDEATTVEPIGMDTWLADLEPGTTITVTSDTAPSDPSVRLLATNVTIEPPAAVSSAPIVVARNDEPMEATVDRLPATASPLPFILFAAIGSIVAGIGVRGRELRARRA